MKKTLFTVLTVLSLVTGALVTTTGANAAHYSFAPPNETGGGNN
jgi:hypothetical protein